MSDKFRPWRQRDQHREGKKIICPRGKFDKKIVGLRIDDDFMEADDAVHHNSNWDHRNQEQV